MKKVTIAVASLFAAASFSAVAAPVEMTKKEMSKVVAGAQPAGAGLGLTTAGGASDATSLPTPTLPSAAAGQASGKANLGAGRPFSE
jgi:hypothetical protein